MFKLLVLQALLVFPKLSHSFIKTNFYNPYRCVCVPRHLCVANFVHTDGQNIIDPRERHNITRRQCGPFEVCCSQKNIIERVEQCKQRRYPRITSPQSKVTKFADRPWHVAIIELVNGKSYFICSGVLITSRHILTAAHCVNQRNRRIFARVGEWNTQTTNEPLPHSDYRVKRTIIHPYFEPKNLWNDIAILLLNGDVSFRWNVNPICLPQHTLIKLSKCLVTGWGKNRFKNGQYSAVLQEAEVNIWNFEACQEQLRKTKLGKQFKLHPSFLCAGGSRDSCTGDGGGPLACRGIDNSFYLAGIVSWGIECGQSNIPGVYVNIAEHLPWIEKMIKFT